MRRSAFEPRAAARCSCNALGSKTSFGHRNTCEPMRHAAFEPRAAVRCSCNVLGAKNVIWVSQHMRTEGACGS